MLNVVNKDAGQFSLLKLTHRAKHTRACVHIVHMHARAHSGKANGARRRPGRALVADNLRFVLMSAAMQQKKCFFFLEPENGHTGGHQNEKPSGLAVWIAWSRHKTPPLRWVICTEMMRGAFFALILWPFSAANQTKTSPIRPENQALIVMQMSEWLGV